MWLLQATILHYRFGFPVQQTSPEPVLELVKGTKTVLLKAVSMPDKLASPASTAARCLIQGVLAPLPCLLPVVDQANVGDLLTAYQICLGPVHVCRVT